VGGHDVRLDGLADLLVRAGGASVLDIGCNRGRVCLDMVHHGARLVHGLDLIPKAIQTAREFFADIDCRAQFEVGDLTHGPGCFDPFGPDPYDIVLMLSTYHKIQRPPSDAYMAQGAVRMSAEELTGLMQHIGGRTRHFLGFRSPTLEHFVQVDRDLSPLGLRRIHTSQISSLGPTAIWSRT